MLFSSGEDGDYAPAGEIENASSMSDDEERLPAKKSKKSRPIAEASRPRARGQAAKEASGVCRTPWTGVDMDTNMGLTILVKDDKRTLSAMLTSSIVSTDEEYPG